MKRCCGVWPLFFLRIRHSCCCDTRMSVHSLTWPRSRSAVVTLGCFAACVLIMTAGCYRRVDRHTPLRAFEFQVGNPTATRDFQINKGNRTAHILHVTSQEICFLVQFSSSSRYATVGIDPNNFVYQMRGDKGWRRDYRLRRGRSLSHRGVIKESYDVHNGMRRECVARNEYGECEVMEARALQQARTREAEGFINSSAATVCFPNRQDVVPESKRLVLSIRTAGYPEYFRWGFASR